MGCISINRDEVLRYLGYKNQILDENIEELIEECINEMRKIAKERYVLKFFNIDKQAEKITLEDTDLCLTGTEIYKHLEHSETCVLMAVTLGSEVDKRIRYYEKINMTKALILDACASTAVEEVCDWVCREIEGMVTQKDKTLTSRFSPGYGDLTIEVQKKFISVLGADKVIGLAVTQDDILIPRKSVTAVLGIVNKNVKIEEKSCLSCNKYLNCGFRRESGSCGA